MMVRPRTSTETIRKMGSSGDLRKQSQYDGNRSRERYGRPTLSFLLAPKLQRTEYAAAVRKGAETFPVLAFGAAAFHVQGAGGGLQRAAGAGNPATGSGFDR